MSRKWYHKLFGKGKNTEAKAGFSLVRGGRISAATRWHVKPTLEILEDRVALSNFNVADGDVGGLVSALNTSATNGEQNVINLAQNGTYVLTNSVDGLNGLPTLLADSNVTINGNGATIERSTAPGTPNFRLFDVAANATLILNNLSVENGDVLGADGATGANGGDAEGGGIFLQGGILKLIHTSIFGIAQGGDGGAGIASPSQAGNGGNGGQGLGGGIYNDGGAVTISGGNVRGTAKGGAGGWGGNGYTAGSRSHKGGNGGDGGAGGQAAGGGIYNTSGGVVTLSGGDVSGTIFGGAGGLGGSGGFGGRNSINGGRGGDAGAGAMARGAGIFNSKGTIIADGNSAIAGQGYGGAGGDGGAGGLGAGVNAPGFGGDGGGGGNAAAGGAAMGGGIFNSKGTILLDGGNGYEASLSGFTHGGHGGNGGQGNEGGTGGGFGYGIVFGYGGAGGQAAVGGDGLGGGLYNDTGSVIITGSNISTGIADCGTGGAGGNGGTNGGNAADGASGGLAAGGGIYNVAGSIAITASLVSGSAGNPGSGYDGDGGTGGSGESYKGGIFIPPGKAGNGAAGSNAFGGAIYSGGGNIDIEQSRLFSSTATGSMGGTGGFAGDQVAAGTADTGGQGGRGGQGEGGALAIFGGAATINNSTFDGNQATGGEGGIGAQGGPGIYGAKAGKGGAGGAGGDGRGGDVFLSGGTLSLTNCTFAGSYITPTNAPEFGANGGAGGNGGPGGNTSLSANAAVNRTGGNGGNGGNGLGGAIYVGAGSLDLSSSTLADWQAQQGAGGAGGVGGYSDKPGIAGISGNGLGGGIYVASGAAAKVFNSLIAGNSASNFAAADVSGAFTSLGHNLLGNASGATGFGATGDLLGTSANPIDPKLGAIVANGGGTSDVQLDTLALQPGSPAINAPNLPCTPVMPTTDERGVPRDSQPDIGAYEYSIPPNPYGWLRDGEANVPVVNAAGLQTAFANSSTTFDLGSFNDTTLGSWQVSVDWGDKSSPTTFTVPATTLPPTPSPLSMGTQTHAYAAPGVYTVKETVTNPDGAVGTGYFLVTVGSLAVTPAATTVTAGTSTNLTVSVRDAFNRPVTDYTGSFQLSSTDPTATFRDAATSTPLAGNSYSFTSADMGSHVFTVTQDTAGVQTVRVIGTGAGAPVGSAAITVTPAPASKVVFTQTPSSATTGSPFSATAAFEDRFGNLETSDSSDQVTLSIASGPGSFAPGSTVVVNATNGIANFGNLVLNTAGTYTLRVASGTLTAGNSAAIMVNGSSNAPTNVSSAVSVTRSGFRYDFVHHEFVQTVTITNTSSSAMVGPLALQLMGLSSDATLANASGTDANGNPYIDFVTPTGQLAVGQSITVTLYFNDPTLKAITYDTQVWQNL